MRLNQVIRIGCIVIGVILFLDGLLILKIAPKGNVGDQKIVLEGQDQGESSIFLDAPMNILVLGMDEEEKRSDVIMLLNFRPGKQGVNVLSIARDTLVKVKGKRKKINAVYYMNGIHAVEEFLQKLTGLKVDHYVTFNFKGFREIVDTVGGVQFEVPMEMNYDDPVQNLHIHLKKGSQVLDGDQAEQLVRYRKGNKAGEGYEDGDLDRVKVQQEFVKAFIHQKLRLEYILQAKTVFDIIKKYLKTDIGFEDLAYLANRAQYLSSDPIRTFTVPGTARYVDQTWYYLCSVSETKKMIQKYFF